MYRKRKGVIGTFWICWRFSFDLPQDDIVRSVRIDYCVQDYNSPLLKGPTALSFLIAVRTVLENWIKVTCAK